MESAKNMAINTPQQQHLKIVEINVKYLIILYFLMFNKMVFGQEMGVFVAAVPSSARVYSPGIESQILDNSESLLNHELLLAIEQRCQETQSTAPYSPYLFKLACLWPQLRRELIAGETDLLGTHFSGNLAQIHLGWGRGERTQRLRGIHQETRETIYLNYLGTLISYQISTLYLIRSIQVDWPFFLIRRVGGEGLSYVTREEALRSLVYSLARRSGLDDFTQNINQLRLFENLERRLGLDLRSDIESLQSEIHGQAQDYLQQEEVLASVYALRRSRESHDSSSPQHLWVHFVKALWGGENPGQMGLHPLAMFFVSYSDQENHLLSSLDDESQQEKFIQWIEASRSPQVQNFYKNVAGFFRHFDMDDDRNLLSCGFMSVMLNELSQQLLTTSVDQIDYLLADCGYAVDYQTGFNLWSVLGLSLDQPSPSLNRLERFSESISISNIDAWIVSQAFVWRWMRWMKGQSDQEDGRVMANTLERISLAYALIDWLNMVPKNEGFKDNF